MRGICEATLCTRSEYFRISKGKLEMLAAPSIAGVSRRRRRLAHLHLLHGFENLATMPPAPASSEFLSTYIADLDIWIVSPDVM